MKASNYALFLVGGLSLMMLFSSCETSKIAYGNSYYFKATPKKSFQALENQEVVDEKLMVSLIDEAPAVQIEEKVEMVEQKIAYLQSVQAEREALLSEGDALSRTEKKELLLQEKTTRKELRKEVKALVKEYKQAPQQTTNSSDISGNTRTGIIIGAAGLVLLIIGGPILGLVGSILVVVGLVLILLDIL